MIRGSPAAPRSSRPPFIFGFVLFATVLADCVTEEHDAAAVAVFGIVWTGLVLASGMIAIVGAGAIADLYAVEPVRAEPSRGWVRCCWPASANRRPRADRRAASRGSPP
jgi:hypothetical protein